jgi:hypothetical protein
MKCKINLKDMCNLGNEGGREQNICYCGKKFQ